MIYTNLAALVARLGFACMMLTHGYPKFTKLITGNTAFADPLGLGEVTSLVLAVVGEFLCPVLIIAGFKTRIAAIPPGITMLVAAFVVHANDPWGKQEFPLLYFVGFFIVFLLNSGKYSLDYKLKKV